MIYVVLNIILNIILKLIVCGGGKVNYCGKVFFGKNVKGFKFNIECDMIILDGILIFDIILINVIKNFDVFL